MQTRTSEATQTACAARTTSSVPMRTRETPHTFEPYDDDPLDFNNYDFDDEDLAEDYGLPIEPFTEEDLRFLRDFILGTAMYVEQLEAIANEQSDEFWQAREHAYRIITAVLIRHYEYVLEIE